MAKDLHATPLYPRIKALEQGALSVGPAVDAKIKASETSTKAYVDQKVRNVGIGSTNTQIKSNKDAIIVNSTRISANSVAITNLDVKIDDLLATDLEALQLAIQQERDERIDWDSDHLAATNPHSQYARLAIDEIVSGNWTHTAQLEAIVDGTPFRSQTNTSANNTSLITALLQNKTQQAALADNMGVKVWASILKNDNTGENLGSMEWIRSGAGRGEWKLNCFTSVGVENTFIRAGIGALTSGGTGVEFDQDVNVGGGAGRKLRVYGTTYLNTITERTVDAGVTIELVELKDGLVDGVDIADIGFKNATTFPLLNGASVHSIDVTTSESGGTVYCEIEREGGGDIGFMFQGEIVTMDTTPKASVALTAGTNEDPQINYIYVVQSGPTLTLTATTTYWPLTAHAPVGTVLVQSAASVATDGPFKVHSWTDHIAEDGENGHLSHINRWIRDRPASWTSGCAASALTISSPDAYFTVGSGFVDHLHDHPFPALDMSVDGAWVTNEPTGNFTKIFTFDDINTDANGVSINNKYFPLVVWGVVSENASDCKLFINLPNGTYNQIGSAWADPNQYAEYTIPVDFRGTGFLIARYVVRGKTNGTWEEHVDSPFDLRGTVPSTSPGSTTGITDHGGLAGLADDDHPQYHNDARGDARYSLLGHTHPESDITNLVSDLSAITGRLTVNEGDISALQVVDVSYGNRITQNEDDISDLMDVAFTRVSLGNMSTNENIVSTGDFTAVDISTTGILYIGNADTNLYRASANQLATDDIFWCKNSLWLGTTFDTNLYRSGANTLKTDDDFIASGTLTGTSIYTAGSHVARTVATGQLRLSGGTPSTGAYLDLYGPSHASLANRSYWNASIHNIRSQTGSQYADFGSYGLNLVSGKNFYIANTKVVGAQQSAISNPASTTAGNNAAIDSILAVMRTHGLIAT